MVDAEEVLFKSELDNLAGGIYSYLCYPNFDKRNFGYT